MTARHIAHSLGGQRAQRLPNGGYLVPCPVPSHGKGRGDRSPSLRISDGDTRVLVHCYAGCDARDVLEALRQRGLLDGRTTATFSARKDPPKEDPDAYEREQHRKAAWLWSRRKPITDTPAEIYLRQVRGITRALPSTLAFLPPAKPEHHPALISLFALVGEPEPGVLDQARGVEAVHLTLLKPDGSGKAEVEKPKIIVGSPTITPPCPDKNAPIGLPIIVAPPNDLLGLAITEGIEDGLTVHQATGLGAWAAGAAGRMPQLAEVIPNYVECVTIFAHDDKAGRDGARRLAFVLDARGVEVLIEGLL